MPWMRGPEKKKKNYLLKLIQLVYFVVAELLRNTKPGKVILMISYGVNKMALHSAASVLHTVIYFFIKI